MNRKPLPAEIEWCVKLATGVDAAEHKQLARLFKTAFPEDDEEWWEDCEGDTSTVNFLAKAEGEIVGNVSLSRQEIDLGGSTLVVAGIGGVAVLPDWQQKGIAGALLRNSNEWMEKDAQYEMGMLFCNPKLSAWYATFGYEMITNPIYLTYKNKRQLSDETAMVRWLTRRSLPAGEINLHGPSW